MARLVSSASHKTCLINKYTGTTMSKHGRLINRSLIAISMTKLSNFLLALRQTKEMHAIWKVEWDWMRLNEIDIGTHASCYCLFTEFIISNMNNTLNVHKDWMIYMYIYIYVTLVAWFSLNKDINMYWSKKIFI